MLLQHIYPWVKSNKAKDRSESISYYSENILVIKVFKLKTNKPNLLAAQLPACLLKTNPSEEIK